MLEASFSRQKKDKKEKEKKGGKTERDRANTHIASCVALICAD